jgi:hypothetical protein
VRQPVSDDMRVNAQLRESILIGFMVLLLAGLFSLDIYSPTAFADHEFYVTVVLVATASRSSWMPTEVAPVGWPV